MDHTQESYRVRCEWGEGGLKILAPISDVIVIVDVLSFSTCVDVALTREAEVYAYPWKDERGRIYAEEVGGLLAEKRGTNQFSLSPYSLQTLLPKTKLVLPSPNGSTLTTVAAEQVDLVITSCLRNAKAVGQMLSTYSGTIGLIPAGERWPDGSLRVAVEDWLGAGAVLSLLGNDLSPEAEVAANLFESTRNNLEETLLNCSSGRELVDRGFREDVQIAAELNASQNVPTLREGRYVRIES
ncbi:MAG: 2-phosphosulfolactate phosphatase [Candidatus Kapaibacterium sp.]